MPFSLGKQFGGTKAHSIVAFFLWCTPYNTSNSTVFFSRTPDTLIRRNWVIVYGCWCAKIMVNQWIISLTIVSWGVGFNLTLIWGGADFPHGAVDLLPWWGYRVDEKEMIALDSFMLSVNYLWEQNSWFFDGAVVPSLWVSSTSTSICLTEFLILLSCLMDK